MPLLAARIPPAPAAELGRLRAIADGDTWPTHGPALESRLRVRTGGGPTSGDSPVRDAFASPPPLLVARLNGALELTVPELDLVGVADLTAILGEPFTGRLIYTTMGEDNEAATGMAVLERIRPNAVPLVASPARVLAAHPTMVATLAVGPRYHR